MDLDADELVAILTRCAKDLIIDTGKIIGLCLLFITGVGLLAATVWTVLAFLRWYGVV